MVALLVTGLGLFAAPVASAATSPLLTGSIADSLQLPGATSVAIAGTYAYTTGYWAGQLVAMNFSNPAAPVIAGTTGPSNTLRNASSVNIAGRYAYVASKNRNGGSGSNDDGTGNSLTIVDIATNPAQPRIAGSITDATKLFGAYGVAISGSYAYVAAQGCLGGQPCPNPSAGNSFEVVDVSNPANPRIVAGLSDAALPAPWAGTKALDHACSVAISGNYAYVTAAYSNRLTIINISNPTNPRIVASLLDNTNLKFAVDVALSGDGNYAYVADQSNAARLAVVDVSNPSNPKVVSSVSSSKLLSGAYRVRISGNFAYVSAVYAATVSAIDISNPLKPRIAGSVTSKADLNRTTGLDIDPSSRYVVASSTALSSQSSPLYPPFPLTPGGPKITGTISVIQLDPATIGASITSGPSNSTSQTTANFKFSTTDAVSSVACSLDGAPGTFCTSATSQSYSSLSRGPHTFVVTATDSAGIKAPSPTYAWTIQ